jgi:predicted DNA-binding protein (UPF0251 family)
MQTKGRPKKYRRVHKYPRIHRFSPRGKAGRPDEIYLTMDEFEAIRLADNLFLCQKEAAKSMHISQQTFSRILRKAHRTVADVLVNGKIVKIQGGHYVVTTRHEPSQKNPNLAAPEPAKK